MIKSVIFDFDDTLINNSLLDYEGFIVPCEKLSIPTPNIKKIAYLRKKGLLAKDIALKIQQSTRKKFPISKFLLIRNEFLQSEGSVPFLHLHDGTKNLLSFLNSKKIKCFLCTIRKNKKTVVDFLVRSKIHDYFSDVYLASDTNLNLNSNWPSNRILIKNSLIHKIMKKYSISNDEVIFVGNSDDDYNSALDMHLKFICYENSYISNKIKNVVKVQNMENLQRRLSMILRNP